jgi:hypothetical protein
MESGMKIHDDNPERYGDPDPNKIWSWNQGLDTIYEEWWGRPASQDRSDILFLVGLTNSLYGEINRLDIEKLQSTLASGARILGRS